MERPPVLIISTYPPEHCGVGRDAYEFVQALRVKRPTTVLANIARGNRLQDPTVQMVWYKNDFLYPIRIANAARKIFPRRNAVAHVFHHFFLYGKGATIPLFPVLILLLKVQGFPLAVQFQSVIEVSKFKPNDYSIPTRVYRFLIGMTLGNFYRFISRLSSAIIVCTRSMRDLLVDFYRIDPGKVWIIPVGWKSGVNGLERAGGIEPKDPAKPRTILFHGFIDPTKGLEVLIEAGSLLVHEYPDLQIILAGEVSPHLGTSGASYLASLKDRARDAGIEGHLIFTGYLDNEQLDKTLFASDVIVLPYTMVLSHGGSASLGRIAHLGRPVVASRISRFADELTHGENALLTAPGDPIELSSAIRWVFEHPKEANEMGENLKTLAQKRTWDISARVADEQVYQSITAKSPRSMNNDQ
nr:glycosyltransferase family 4 protein [Ferrimicrobium acidiphilum]